MNDPDLADRLTTLISDHPGESRISARDAAEYLTAEGWRPPAPVVADPDTPDTYPARTVGIDRDGEVWVSRLRDWVVAFDQTSAPERLADIVADFGPLVIVYVPTEAGHG